MAALAATATVAAVLGAFGGLAHGGAPRVRGSTSEQAPRSSAALSQVAAALKRTLSGSARACKLVGATAFGPHRRRHKPLDRLLH
jgi:hypothetical protein